MMLAGILYFTGINVVAFVAYGIDKFKAKRSMWRIPEFTLLLLAFLGGGIGAGIGMKVWHHKTRKWKFRIGVPLAVIVSLGLMVVYAWLIYK